MNRVPSKILAPTLCGASFWVASLEDGKIEIPSQKCADAKVNGLDFSAVKDPPKPWMKPLPNPKVPKISPPSKLPKIIGSGGRIIELEQFMPKSLPMQPFEGYGADIGKIGAAIRAASNGERIRFSFFGASHTQGDFWTGHIRRTLQSRYGDIGHGFILPIPMFKTMRASDINICSSKGWTVDYIGARSGHKDGLLGVGMSASSHDNAHFAWVETTSKNPFGRNAAFFDIFGLGSPEGGTILATVDNKEAIMIPTFAPNPDLVHARIETIEGSHRLSLQPAADGEVRLFGVSVETAGPGVIVDAIGIRGREARNWLQWDEKIFQKTISALNPDVVVLAYGTNEANDTDYTAEQYSSDLRKTLSMLRRSRPDAGCILVGPSDRGKKTRQKGTYKVWDRTIMVAEVQRTVAPDFGCVFWDWQQATGGEGSMIAWLHTNPPLSAKDMIHHSAAGYIHVAEKFIEAMDDAAQNY